MPGGTYLTRTFQNTIELALINQLQDFDHKRILEIVKEVSLNECHVCGKSQRSNFLRSAVQMTSLHNYQLDPDQGNSLAGRSPGDRVHHSVKRHLQCSQYSLVSCLSIDGIGDQLLRGGK